MKTKHNINGMFIEISGKCNAKCPYCAQWRLKQENHFGEIMSPVLFEQILDHLIKIKIIDKSLSYITLYNWGEPFLNPKINDILQILKDRKLKADISSNFIMMPNIDKELLPVIEILKISLSGFTQDSYSRIHGATLSKVLNNFENFYKYLRKYSPKTTVTVLWHRYRFNEKELWDAHKYFNRPGINFKPTRAFLNDGLETIDFLKGNLPKDRLKQAEKDIFLENIKERAYNNKKSKNCYCPQWNRLAIDETGQLLTCCAFTRYDSAHVLGNILEMYAEEIWSSKLSDPICNECISCGFANFSGDRALPSGGGTYGLKTRFHYELKSGLLKSGNALGQLLRKLPNGEKIIYIIKNLK